MARVSIGFGVVLICLGLGAFLQSRAGTSLIPAGFGAALLAMGLLALRESWRMHAMHAAAVLGLVGFLFPAIMGLPKLPALLAEGRVMRADGSDATLAVIVQLSMAVLCLVFLGLCIHSFVQARRRRTAES